MIFTLVDWDAEVLPGDTDIDCKYYGLFFGWMHFGGLGRSYGGVDYYNFYLYNFYFVRLF